MIPKDQTPRWYVVCSPEANRKDKVDPEAAIWTLSRYPDCTGWITDGGYDGYGLKKIDAEELASAANARRAAQLEDAELNVPPAREAIAATEPMQQIPELGGSRVCIGFGYEQSDPGIYLYDPDTGGVLLSEDVVDEGLMKLLRGGAAVCLKPNQKINLPD